MRPHEPTAGGGALENNVWSSAYAVSRGGAQWLLDRLRAAPVDAAGATAVDVWMARQMRLPENAERLCFVWAATNQLFTHHEQSSAREQLNRQPQPAS